MALPLLTFVVSNVIVPWIIGRGLERGFNLKELLANLRQDLASQAGLNKLLGLIEQLFSVTDLPALVTLAHALQAEQERLANRLDSEEGAALARAITRLNRAMQVATLSAAQEYLKQRRFFSTETDEQYLKRLYLGLYLLGLAGGQIAPGRKLARLLLELVTLHGQPAREPGSRPAVAVLSHFTPEQGALLEAALIKVPEVSALSADSWHIDPAAFITVALGGQVESEPRCHSLINELPERFPTILNTNRVVL